ncbi:MAG TPA: tetratricopeptide repeat protein, partial [candidate division Zixibacteria bacterium]|nr:tetratricopeptide repeat protein [candidate division Zixibacteria bacterium]
MHQINVPAKRWQLVAEVQNDESAVKEINELLSREDYSTAFPRLCELADQDYLNANINVVTGLVAISLGKKNDADRYFRRALQADPNDADALHNSAVLAMSNGDIETAQSCFEKLAELQPVDAMVYNDLAVIWMNKGNLAKVKECFTKALELNPNFGQARKNAMEFALNNNMGVWGQELLNFNNKQPGLTSTTVKDIHMWIKVIANEEQQAQWATITSPTTPTSLQMSGENGRICNKKIAFFASYKTFVTDIMEQLKSDNNEIREFTLGSPQSMLDLMDWADLAWFEWCDNLLIEATKYPKKCPIVCRLHSYEAFSDMPVRVDWSKVDQLIFVNRSVEELVRPLITTTVPWTVVHNGVDCEKFEIPAGKQYGKQIASVGYINYKKNPTLMLYCFK